VSSNDRSILSPVVPGGSPPGDEADFANFFRATFSRTIAYVILMFNVSETDAADVTQEAFLITCRSWSSVRSYENPEAYLRKVARHLAIDLRRKQARQHPADLETLIKNESDVTASKTDYAAETELAVDIVRMLAMLPHRQRMIFTMMHFYQMTIKEISIELGVSASTVAVHLHRARSSLREYLVKRDQNINLDAFSS